MNRKNIMALAAIALCASCSNIGDDERFIDAGKVEPDANRCILIEDFTGQNCVNCPDAMVKLDELHEAFGDAIVAVGIYGGPFGKTVAGKYYPLTTETGDYYATQRNIQEQPCGYFNRKTMSTNASLWASIATELLLEKSYVTISALATCRNEQITVDVNVSSMSDYSKTRLQVWLIEDNVVSRQKLADNSTNLEFVHNHVFRASVNDRDGEAIDVTMGQETNKTYTITPDAEWKLGDLSVVAFVFNDQEVLQTVKVPVITEN
ncbi:MAG: Omp28 family outer membrane lipoprotein [bacterium]|nr:Omp28 family outer membrane lipoprotein [bacterium]MDD6026420.1 Omp28 family outer membrane lipoprotein [bacterium]